MDDVSTASSEGNSKSQEWDDVEEGMQDSKTDDSTERNSDSDKESLPSVAGESNGEEVEADLVVEDELGRENEPGVENNQVASSGSDDTIEDYQGQEVRDENLRG